MTRRDTLSIVVRVLLPLSALLLMLAPMRAEAWEWKDGYKRGCTLTQGYWKTHSYDGPAPCDDGWGKLCGNYDYCSGNGYSCEQKEFYDSGKDWLEALWTPPKGNAYWQLAHQYIAAVLNTKNGAWAPWKVKWAIWVSHRFFQKCDPYEVASLRGQQKCAWFTRHHIRWLAGILGAYNEGHIGPGHCDKNGYDNDNGYVNNDGYGDKDENGDDNRRRKRRR